MPQDSIFPSDTTYHGFRLEFVDDLTPQGVRWRIAAQRLDGVVGWKTCWVATWHGVMLDCVPTLASEAYTTFLYGENRDMVPALSGVHRMAKDHARRHQF